MISRLELKYFKCFELLKLPIAPLTILSGTNASGKSSVLQALVLLHQTMREHEWSKRLMLNGNAIRLGTVSDVVDKAHGRRSFEIKVIDGNNAYHWAFEGNRAEMSLMLAKITINGNALGNPEPLRYLLPSDCENEHLIFANRFLQMTYVAAERVGPREVYPLEDSQTAIVVGPQGEHAVSVLYWGMDRQVTEELILSEVPNTLFRQVEERMRTFFPGCSLDVQKVSQTNSVTLGLRTSNDTDFHRPIHVGYGLTQVFPIVVAALSLSKGDILLVENPEVHLHPAGQALMGKFLADVAHAGVQVIIETHSDHIINGIRRAVRSNMISHEQVAIHFFRSRSENGSQVESPQLDQSGNIDVWPSGFFDQFDKDMNYLADWGE